MKNKIENIRPCHTQKDKHMQEKDRLKCNFKNAPKKILKRSLFESEASNIWF